MLLKSGLLAEYLKAAEAVAKITGSYITWNGTTQTISLNKEPVYICFITCSFFGIAQMYDVSKKVTGSHPLDEQLTLGILLGMSLLLTSQFSFCTLRHYKVIEEFVHGLIQFEMWYCNEWNSSIIQNKGRLTAAKFTCMLMRITGIISTPLFLSLCAVAFPTLPMNVLSYDPGFTVLAMLREFFVRVVPKLICVGLIKSIILVTNTLVWYTMFKGGVMVSNRIFIGTVSLSVAVSVFRSHVASVQFIGQRWSRIGADITFQKSLMIYKQIQIYSTLFNHIHSTELVTFLFIVVMGQVTSAFNLIGKSIQQSSKASAMLNCWIRIVFVQVIILCVAVINVMYGFCGIVHDTSRKCLKEIKHDININRCALNRKCLKSLTSIDIKFGSANFIEKTTPVIYQQFSAQRTVDILLLLRRRSGK